MKPGIPWSVKGIGDGVREAAKEAARRSGLTLGEWLNSVILEQTALEEGNYSQPPAPLRPADSREDFGSKLDDIAAQLVRFASHEAETTPFLGRAETDREGVNQVLARLDSNEHKTAEALQAIKAHLAIIDERLAQVPRSAFPTKLEEVPSYQRLERALRNELRDIETRIHGALKDAHSALRAVNPMGDILRLRFDIESLTQRIDELKADAASDRDLHSLRAAMEQLSARVAQGPDLGPFADMDRRVAEIARRIEQAQGHTGLEPQMAELERRVYELDRQLAEAMIRQQDTRASDALERQVASISYRLGQTEEQIAHLATLEQSISQLFQSLEASREAVPTPSAELVALEQGLEAVRASADAGDRRNQETLQAVRDTLAQIVSRIAELEGSKLVEVPASPQADPALPASESAPAYQPDGDNGFAGESFKQEDFIAAARRATQTVAGTGPGGHTLPAEKHTEITADQPASAISNDGKRKRLILAGLVLLAAVSAYAFSALTCGSGEPASIIQDILTPILEKMRAVEAKAEPLHAAAQKSSYGVPLLGAAVDMSQTEANPISQAQGLLNDLGYGVGTSNGRMGSRTENAIMLFQLRSGMKVTGNVSSELIAKLKARKG